MVLGTSKVYVEFSRGVRFAVVKTLFPLARLAERQGTSTEAADYCKKDGTFEEHGVMSEPVPGRRSDIASISDLILSGVSMREIAMSHPEARVVRLAFTVHAFASFSFSLFCSMPCLSREVSLSLSVSLLTIFSLGV